jgi:hypothetical protein
MRRKGRDEGEFDEHREGGGRMKEHTAAMEEENDTQNRDVVRRSEMEEGSRTDQE